MKTNKKKIDLSKYKPWQIIFGIAFLPFTLSYFIWKQPVPRKNRIGGIIVVWVVFILLTSNANSKNNNETIESEPKQEVAEEVQAVKEEQNSYTFEQKQDDYKSFYKEFIKQGQAVVLTQVTLIEASNDPNVSPEELYLKLDTLSELQNTISMKTAELSVPDSLKEYKELSSGKIKLAVASRHFKSAIENFQKYLNKNDLEALSDAKYKSGLGESQLEESINDVESVAKELEIDIDSLKVNN